MHFGRIRLSNHTNQISTVQNSGDTLIVENELLDTLECILPISLIQVSSQDFNIFHSSNRVHINRNFTRHFKNLKMKFLVILFFATLRGKNIPELDSNLDEENFRLKLLAYQNATSIRCGSIKVT